MGKKKLNLSEKIFLIYYIDYRDFIYAIILYQ